LNFDVSHLRINEINEDYNAIANINIANSIQRLNNINRLFYNYNETNEFHYVDYNNNSNAIDSSDSDSDIESDDDNDTIIILDNGETSQVINSNNNHDNDNDDNHDNDNDNIVQQATRRRTYNHILLNTPNIDPIRMPNTSNFIYNSVRNHLFEQTTHVDTDTDIYWFIDRNGDRTMNE